jgi:hypothetical protein
VKTIFLRAAEADDKAAALLATIRNPAAAQGKQRFEVDPAGFACLPGAPFAYWVSDRLRQLFSLNTSLAGSGIETKCGLGTLDDFRFLRAWWELPASAFWVPLVKGGTSVSWYSDLPILVSWKDGGRELKTYVEHKVGSASRKIQAQSYYFRPGITWSRRPHKRGWFRASPSGAIFADNGPMAFAAPEVLERLLPLLNSSLANYLMQTMMSRGQGDSGQTLTYEVGVIDALPLPARRLPEGFLSITRRAWSLRRSIDIQIETSHAFCLPALLHTAGSTLAELITVWCGRVSRAESNLAQIQAEVDDQCFDLYEVNQVDRQRVLEGFRREANSVGDGENTDGDIEVEQSGDVNLGGEPASLVADLVSWAVGVAFGRFDVRLATGGRELPREPDLFDPLPACSPSMLADSDGLALATSPPDYPLMFPSDGLLVDDPGHQRDLAAAVRTVFNVVFGDSADSRWQEAAALLDSKDHDLGNWLAKGFFEHHLKRYSKSHRKAPNLWQLSTPSASYSVWFYAHRLTQDSFFKVQNDLVAPKLLHEERRLSSLTEAAGPNPTARDRKVIAGTEAIVEELQAMLEEVKRVAPLMDPDLNDGVVLAMAPLWRLVPQHRAWQKELKRAWDTLYAGKYDWAHVAMHLWPERVVPKCASDRSLAIAHGLEDVFWVENATGKWGPRAAPTRTVDELVQERTSPAVKAALQSLLQAPAAPNGVSSGLRRTTAATAHAGVR